MAGANGRLPASELASIGNGFYLEREAAAAFNAMSAEAERRWGRPIRVIAAYRPLWKQQYLYNGWIRHLRGFNLAAFPGTSNHGWGLAIDLASGWDRWAVDQIGRAYGWSKSWSDAQSEWWHITYRHGVWHGHAPTPASSVLREGMRNERVRELQRRLYALGFHSVARDGHFGPKTLSAVKRFQRAHHLTVDGRVGPKTTAALKRAVR